MVDSEVVREAHPEAAALMAHELQGPVTVILGCVSMLREGGLPADAQETALKMIEGEARGMGTMVRNLLGAGGSGPEGRDRERFEADELVTQVIQRIRAQAELNGATVEPLCTGAPLPATVEAVPERVRCVLSGLIRNAIAYSLAPARVFVETRNVEAGDRVEIAVHDYGLGIAKADHERVFEPGVRLHESVPGTGMGLHLSRRLAENEGGSLRLEWSEPLQGSVFVLALPRAQQG
ncbi:MAG TPA: HAMP domain-containing sensor histidine kinase [Candidatus Dormibacteraeota bacterium]|jgi:signal transduction histidine kinase|nr:HAMP domain-containing sensor histidine kinase [Candidatus Dormibacteraeota bacterium]